MTVFAPLQILLAALGSVEAACPAQVRQLVGEWSGVGEETAFEEFALEEKDGARVFHSWLHQRPEIGGAAWRVEDCHLIVVPGNAEFEPLRFRIVSLRHGRLRLRDVSDQTESDYVRLPAGP